MNTELIVLFAILGFAILILLEVPIALALALSGALGIFLLRGQGVTESSLTAVPYYSTAKYGLFVIPMFVLLGTLIANAGIGAQIFSAAHRLFGWLPNGLAAATVVAVAIFSGISGSSAADVGTMGRVSVGEMRKHGYDAPMAAAVVAAAGTFACLIPPSIVLVLYGIIADQSISAMILAGIIPGVISCIALIVFLVIRGVMASRKIEVSVASGAVTTAGPRPHTKAPNIGTLRSSAAGLLYAAILFITVAGGIYAGVFTSSEAGAMGAFAALLIVLVVRKSRPAPLHKIVWSALQETATLTSMIFLLVFGGAVFTYFIASAGFPAQVTQFITELDIPPRLVIALFLVMILIMGMFLDGLSILLLIVPIVAPVVDGFGYDGVWFGILVLKCIEIGLITPPVGTSVFIIASLVPDSSLSSIFKAVRPFILLDIAITAVFFAFPTIVTWLPMAASG